MSTVLVSGGSGFIGSHCIVQLLAAGHSVRTTVRQLAREEEVRAMLREGGQEPGERLRFHAADLMSDAGWPQAIAGCEYVLHVASPFPADAIFDENELIIPARDGTLRVLRASRDAGVRRVVLTSSFAAIGYGHEPRNEPFSEADWTDLHDGQIAPYTKAKTLAERAAWDFVAREGAMLELSVVNPVVVFGPVLGPDCSTSIQLIQRMLNGGMPAAAKLHFGVVDVRDVADLHLRAMTHPAARGERFLALAGDFMSLLEIAKVLKQHFGSRAKRAPSIELPNWLVRLIASRVPALKQLLPELGKVKNATNGKARRLLGWSPRSNEECIIATAQSLDRLAI